MWLVVGLGNPGPKYERTRHNIGFMVIDLMSQGAHFKSEHKALVARAQIGDQQVLLAKPQTYMNLSGESVVAMTQFYKIPLERLIVIHDEVEIPYRYMKIQKNRGPGGNNGVKSVSGLLGSADYIRVRMGVGRPSTPMDVADWVLQNFSKTELETLPEFLAQGQQAVEMIIRKGFNEAASIFNQKPKLNNSDVE